MKKSSILHKVRGVEVIPTTERWAYLGLHAGVIYNCKITYNLDVKTNTIHNINLDIANYNDEVVGLFFRTMGEFNSLFDFFNRGAVPGRLIIRYVEDIQNRKLYTAEELVNKLTVL